MNTAEILTILDDEKAWLAKQPGMEPWDEGCRQVVALLESRLDQYSGLVCEPKPAQPDGEPEPEQDSDAEPEADPGIYLARLARCLIHHWRDAVNVADDGQAEAARVAEEIAAGRGYRRGRKLGGDPLRDVVLAVAVVRRDERATQIFQAEYYPLACAVAAKIHPCLEADPDAWWSKLLDRLAGYPPPAKLDRFDGRCGLRNWLRRVVWNFLCRWRLTDDESLAMAHLPGPSPLPDESLAHFAEIVRLAVATLSPQWRLMLALVYVDGLKQNEAAAILGVHPGTVTRGLEKALPRLENSIREIAATQLSQEACAGVFEDLRGNPRLFAARLRAALEEGREQS